MENVKVKNLSVEGEFRLPAEGNGGNGYLQLKWNKDKQRFFINDDFRGFRDLTFPNYPDIDATAEMIKDESIKIDSKVDTLNKSLTASIAALKKSIDALGTKKVDVHGNIIGNVLNKNAFLLGGDLTGYGTAGQLKIEAVHPNTKAFEGPYTPTKPSTATSDPHSATTSKPYWFGRYNCGPRVGRGGLANGWGSASNGRILKITKPYNSDYSSSYAHSYAHRLMISVDKFHRNNFRFRCWMYVAKGKTSGYALRTIDDGGDFSVPSIKKWHLVDVVLSTSHVTYGYLSFSMKFADEGEVYMAMPQIYAVDRDNTFINRT